MSKAKCKLCDRIFVDKNHLVTHIDKSHASQIPEGWSASRYENYLRTGKTHGNCVICKCETPWNSATGKYCRMCTKDACRKQARENATKNLMKKRGVTHSQLLSDPEFQRKMVYSKKNSGTYKFSDDNGTTQVMYDSSYGKDFLEMLDLFMNFCSCDIMGPSPHTYVYVYKGTKHFYIPDFYIPSLNLEIEIKDGGDNPNNHPKIQAVDKVKEKLKDDAMASQNVNYVKVANKNYTLFYKMLYMLKEEQSVVTTRREFISLTESALTEQAESQEKSMLSTVMWFYNQAANISTDEELVSLRAKLDMIIHSLQEKINDNDIAYDDRRDAKSAYVDLQSLSDNLSYMSSQQMS